MVTINKINTQNEILDKLFMMVVFKRLNLRERE